MVTALETRLEGPILLRPAIHADARGFFQESYRREAWARLGVGDEFVQDNHSRSARGVLRGLHFQVGAGQAKLVRCPRGAVVDVVVDIRRGSPSFGEWESFVLDEENMHQLYCPIGFAHGFCVTSESADVMYKCSAYYEQRIERGIAWDDPDIGVQWPREVDPVVSPRDAGAPRLREVGAELPFEYAHDRPGAS